MLYVHLEVHVHINRNAGIRSVRHRAKIWDADAGVSFLNADAQLCTWDTLGERENVYPGPGQAAQSLDLVFSIHMDN
jgi:hypothetical protein